MIAEDYENLPDEMLNAKRWILWKREKNPKPDKKDLKVPYYANGSKRYGELDSKQDLERLANFEQAFNSLQSNKYTGLGFALGQDETGNYWQGIDLDEISKHPELGYIQEDLPSYTEMSPNGDGWHSIGYGRKFESMGSNDSGIECYSYGRYFTVTGECSGNGKICCIADFAEQRLKPMHNKYVSNVRSIDIDVIEVSDKTIAELRSALLFMRSDDRELWQRNGHRLKGLGDVGRGLWLEWSSTSDKFDPESDAKTWESFKPTHTGYKSVFSEAQRMGWVNPAKKQNYDFNIIVDNKDTHNEVLDGDENKYQIDFLKHVDDKHLLKQLAVNVSKVCDLPVHSVFMMGMAVFSSMACRVYKVNYQHGGSLPIGLYVIAEQPSGATKSRTLSVFQSSFIKKEREYAKKHKENIGRLKSIQMPCDDEKDELKRLLDKKMVPLFATNPTQEAIEEKLDDTKGFFSAVSSEQGLFNTMLGQSYGDGKKANNNDILLNGFDAGYVSSMRITRKGYFGNVIGGAVMFAQQGSIEKLLAQSNGTGLSERFLLLAEGHYLGTRNFLDRKQFYKELIEDYNHICDDISEIILTAQEEYENLIELNICDDGWNLINEFRNVIEPNLADGCRYSHIAIRGAAAKIDMQIMKMASILHLLSGDRELFSEIQIHNVKTAIDIAHALIEANLSLCTDKGITGRKAEYVSILSLFEHDSRPRTERNIIQGKSKTLPFKDLAGNKSDIIRKSLCEMVDDNLLQIVYSATNVMMYAPAQ